MTGLFQRMFGRGTGQRAPRLTEAEAERIAREAAAGSPYADRLLAQDIAEEGGRLVWRFRTPTRGSWLGVDVDDATGHASVNEMRGR